MAGRIYPLWKGERCLRLSVLCVCGGGGGGGGGGFSYTTHSEYARILCVRS